MNNKLYTYKPLEYLEVYCKTLIAVGIDGTQYTIDLNYWTLYIKPPKKKEIIKGYSSLKAAKLAADNHDFELWAKGGVEMDVVNIIKSLNGILTAANLSQSCGENIPIPALKINVKYILKSLEQS